MTRCQGIRRQVEDRKFLLSTYYFPLSSAPFAEQHRVHRLEHDHGVEFERVMPDVIEIVFQFLDRILVALAVWIIHLGPTGDSRLHQMAEMIERNLLFVTLRTLNPFRPWSDQAHVAPE